MSLAAFNKSVNSVLDPLLRDNDVVLNVLRIFLIVYSAYIASALPPAMATLFAHPVFRIMVMALIVWIYNHDPVTSVLIAVGYFVTLTYFMKNGFKQLAQTGIIPSGLISFMSSTGSEQESPVSAVTVSQGTVPQETAKVPSGYATTPEATLSSTPSDGKISTVPSETPATTASMMDVSRGGHPHAYVPDDLYDLARVPRK